MCFIPPIPTSIARHSFNLTPTTGGDQARLEIPGLDQITPTTGGDQARLGIPGLEQITPTTGGDQATLGIPGLEQITPTTGGDQARLGIPGLEQMVQLIDGGVAESTLAHYLPIALANGVAEDPPGVVTGSTEP